MEFLISGFILLALIWTLMELIIRVTILFAETVSDKVYDLVNKILELVKFPSKLASKICCKIQSFIFVLVILVSIGLSGTGIYKVVCSLYQEDSSDEYHSNDGYYEDGESNYDSEPGIHHVEPHYVEGYTRSDGTEVEGYWRGGDDGYYRSNPDGNPNNNLDSGGFNYESNGSVMGDMVESIFDN